MLEKIVHIKILEAGWVGCSALSTIASSIIALGVFMIWYDHIKSKKKKFHFGFNKDTGLLLIFLSMALMILSSWV